MTVTKNQKLVPLTPSENMITSGKDEYHNCSSNPDISIEGTLRRIYAAMIDIAPDQQFDWTINIGIQPVEDEVMVTVKFRDDDIIGGLNAKYWKSNWIYQNKPWDIVEWKYSK